MLKKDMSVSPSGRRNAEKGHDLLPHGESDPRKLTCSPPHWGGDHQEFEEISSPARELLSPYREVEGQVSF